MKLTEEQKTEFLAAQADINGVEDAIQTAIRAGSRVFGEGQKVLQSIWQQLAKDHNLQLENGKYRVEPQENGDLLVVEVPESERPKDPTLAAEAQG